VQVPRQRGGLDELDIIAALLDGQPPEQWYNEMLGGSDEDLASDDEDDTRSQESTESCRWSGGCPACYPAKAAEAANREVVPGPRALDAALSHECDSVAGELHASEDQGGLYNPRHRV